MTNAMALVSALGGRWRNGHGLCRCPAHEDRTPSLSVALGQDSRLLFHCFAGCSQEAVLGALRRHGLIESNKNFSQRTIRQGPNKFVPASLCRTVALKWSHNAEAIWQRAVPLRNTPAETYLRRRGCWIDSPGALRFTTWQGHPTMVALITDAISGKPQSLHFTLLAPDGATKAAVDRPKLLLAGHRKQGGVIRLVADEDVTHGLGLTEGIETGLAVMASGWRPVWAAIDAGNLGSLPVLDGIESLTVFADHDSAGLAAANKCAARWRSAGNEARVIVRGKAGADWADPP